MSRVFWELSINPLPDLRLQMRKPTAMQRQTAVTAYLKSEQLLLFAFAGQFTIVQGNALFTTTKWSHCPSRPN